MKVVLKEVALLLTWLGVGFLLVPGILWVFRELLMSASADGVTATSLIAAYQELYAGLNSAASWLLLLIPYGVFLIIRLSMKPREPEGYTKLGLAVFREDDDSIQSLIAGGAEIVAEDGDGRTPLHLAATKERVDIIRLLLDGGAEIDAAEPRLGLRPLHFSAREGNTDVCEVLIRHGADIDARNLMGETALHYAVEYGHADVVSLLLKYRARPDIRNNNNKTPLQCAMDSGNTNITELIRQHVSDEWPYLQLSNG